MFFKFVSFVLGCVVVLVIVSAGPAVWWWDRRGAGQPAFLTGHFLFWHWSAPESLKAQGADANAKLAVAIKDVASLESAVAQQNAATQALAARGATALQDAQKAVQRYASASQATATRVRIISAPIVGDDTCARVKAFDATFLEALK